MAKYQKKKDLMLGEDQFDLMAPELEQSTGFPGEASLEDVEEEQAAGPDVGELQKRLARLESEATALTGLVKAQGDKPDTQILNRLSEIKREQSSLQDLVKASPVSPTEPTGPSATPTSSVSPGAETKPSNLLESFSKSTSNAGKLGAGAPSQNGTVTPSASLSGFKPEPEKPEDTLLARLKRAETTREEARKRADIGQLAEMVGRSLTQIGAAQQGMRTGVDLSGVAQGKGIDWEARRAEIAKDYETELASVSKEREQLIEKERRAEEANNQKELLALKKQELGLSQRETAAKIDKLREEARAIKEAAGKPDSKEAASALERANKTMEKLDDSFYKVETLNSGVNKAVEQILQDRKANKSTAASERGIITTYLKSLDPDSAVLAAEQLAFINAGTTEDLLNAITSKEPGVLDQYIKDKVQNRMSESKLQGLKESANLQFKNQKQAYQGRVRKVLRSAHEGGVTNVYQILGREPTPEELDEVTSRFWGGKQAAQPTETETTPKGTMAPRTKMPGVVGFKSADEFLQSRGK